jgi:hypothetical protein
LNSQNARLFWFFPGSLPQSLLNSTFRSLFRHAAKTGRAVPVFQPCGLKKPENIRKIRRFRFDGRAPEGALFYTSSAEWEIADQQDGKSAFRKAPPLISSVFSVAPW